MLCALLQRRGLYTRTGEHPAGKKAAGRHLRKADVAVGYALAEAPWYETKAELSRLASKVTRGGLTGMDVANGRSGEIPCTICSCLDFRMGV